VLNVDGKRNKKHVCVACANAARGKFALTKITGKQRFECYALKGKSSVRLTSLPTSVSGNSFSLTEPYQMAGLKFFRNSKPLQDQNEKALVDGLLQKCKKLYSVLSV
jgi:hypothetical protein